MDKIEKTEENLQKALNEHVCYEIQMFYYCIDMITSKIELNLDRLRMNTLIESFAIHTRNLLEFLYCKKSNDVNLVAVDYIDKVKWEEIKGKIAPTYKTTDKKKNEGIEDIKKRLNEEITHMSINRLNVKPEDKEWIKHINKIDVLITNFLLKFLSLIKKDFLSENVLREKERVEKRSEN